MGGISIYLAPGVSGESWRAELRADIEQCRHEIHGFVNVLLLRGCRARFARGFLVISEESGRGRFSYGWNEIGRIPSNKVIEYRNFSGTRVIAKSYAYRN